MFGISVNYLAVLACGIAAMVIGFAWYSKALFGPVWMRLAKVSEADMKKANENMPAMYGTMFVSSLIMAYVLAQFISFANASTLSEGALVGFWAWLGFVATVLLTGVLYEQKPLKLYYINAGYHLVTLVVMGAILASWV